MSLLFGATSAMMAAAFRSFPQPHFHSFSLISILILTVICELRNQILLMCGILCKVKINGYWVRARSIFLNISEVHGMALMGIFCLKKSFYPLPRPGVAWLLGRLQEFVSIKNFLKYRYIKHQPIVLFSLRLFWVIIRMSPPVGCPGAQRSCSWEEASLIQNQSLDPCAFVW